MEGLGDSSYIDRLENNPVPNYLFNGPMTSKQQAIKRKQFQFQQHQFDQPVLQSRMPISSYDATPIQSQMCTPLHVQPIKKHPQASRNQARNSQLNTSGLAYTELINKVFSPTGTVRRPVVIPAKVKGAEDFPPPTMMKFENKITAICPNQIQSIVLSYGCENGQIKDLEMRTKNKVINPDLLA